MKKFFDKTYAKNDGHPRYSTCPQVITIGVPMYKILLEEGKKQDPPLGPGRMATRALCAYYNLPEPERWGERPSARKPSREAKQKKLLEKAKGLAIGAVVPDSTVCHGEEMKDYGRGLYCVPGNHFRRKNA